MLCIVMGGGTVRVRELGRTRDRATIDFFVWNDALCTSKLATCHRSWLTLHQFWSSVPTPALMRGASRGDASRALSFTRAP